MKPNLFHVSAVYSLAVATPLEFRHTNPLKLINIALSAHGRIESLLILLESTHVRMISSQLKQPKNAKLVYHMLCVACSGHVVAIHIPGESQLFSLEPYTHVCLKEVAVMKINN